MIGQKAADQVSVRRRRARRGDLAAAEAAAAEALRIAPWDEGAVGLQRRIAEVECPRPSATPKPRPRRSAPRRSTQRSTKPSTALQAKQYEAAIAAYDRALAIDPGNLPAQTGKQARSARSPWPTPPHPVRAPAPGPSRASSQGRTEAKAAPGGGLVGFEDSAGVDVKSGTQGAGLAGTIVFDATPQVPKAGDAFKVAVFLSNEGTQPIPLTPDDRHHDRRRPAAEGTAAPRHDYGGPRPAGPRVADAFGNGVEGQHAVVVDGNRHHHAA